MKNLGANDVRNSGKARGPGPHLALQALLFGAIFIVGCTTDQPQRGGNELSDFEYRVLYPRQYYDSADRLTRFQLDEENAVISRGSK